ncbi:hypothetical protein HJC23_000351 [Cyclotella cryptica]|uniref:Mitochondrial carrier protein n=1 Tax=Cyclotella cryptica TaxID=29204 RepID=A0ABD3PSX0_9STRA|eukprot:CCRYP_013021-RA/>CCRYP_013021-RA protein AED:0.04 eAED:0.04 QI:78/1/1/1/1/1/3/2313/384
MISATKPPRHQPRLALLSLAILLAILAPSKAIPLSPLPHRPTATHTAASHVALVARGGGKSTTAASRIQAAAATTTTTATTTSPSSIQGILQTFLQTVSSARSHLAAAAAARATSIFVMYPIDTIKTRMQIGSGGAVGKIWRMEGLYNGVWGSLMGQVPYGVLTFGSYEIYKQHLLARFPATSPPLIYALSAILGDMTGSGWLCPSEVVKQQLQAGMYGSMGEAVRGIWGKDGLGGFYRGFTGGLARDVPFRVAQLTTFEVAKNLYLRAKRNSATSNNKKNKSKNKHDDDVALSPLEAAICGAAAGSFSAAITNPLDRIKTIMMTDTANLYGGSVAACAAKIVRDDGIAGLFKGVVPRVGYIAPSVCIFFVTYEFVQQKMKMRE